MNSTFILFGWLFADRPTQMLPTSSARRANRLCIARLLGNLSGELFTESAIDSCGAPDRDGIRCSALDTGERDSLDERSLREEEEEDDRQRHYGGGGH